VESAQWEALELEQPVRDIWLQFRQPVFENFLLNIGPEFVEDPSERAVCGNGETALEG
jgi:hypothetical protein